MSRSSPPWWSNPSAAMRYAMAALSIVAAIVAGLLLDRFLETAPFVSLFLCAIMFASWFGGVGPGLLATALSISAFDYFFLPPMHSIAVAFKDIPRLILFAITAAFVIALNAAQRSAAQSLRRTRDDLQTAVQELERLNASLQVENAERRRAEQISRQAERELQVTIDTIPALAARYRRDGSLDFVNQTWRDYTGLSQDSLTGQRWGSRSIPTTSCWSSARGAPTCRRGNRSRWNSACGEPTENIDGSGSAACRCMTTAEPWSNGMGWATTSRIKSAPKARCGGAKPIWPRLSG